MKTHLIKEHTIQPKIDFDKSIGIYPNGRDNLYPVIVSNLLSASPTALQCMELYASFLGGAGFQQNVNVNLDTGDFLGYTPNDLLLDVVESLAKYQGVFIHTNYNALYKSEDFTVLNYENCRLGRKDDKEYHGKIVYSPNGWGRQMKKDKLKVFDTYNSRETVIQTQVDSAGGWEYYKGQILFFSLQQKRIYPLSLIDSAYLFADTEYRMGLFYNSVAKRGFIDNKIIRHKPFEDEIDKSNFEENVKGLMGTENGASVMTLEDEWDSDNQQGNIKIEDLKTDVKADRFAHFEKSASNYIRKSFRNIPPQLIDYISGKLGNSSGEDLRMAQSIYNASTAKDRMRIERMFTLLFSNYKENIGNEWTIKQYKLLDDGTISN